MELLDQYHIRYLAEGANIDESILPNESPGNLVCRLASSKAASISNLYPDRIILGADTIVYFDKKILGKPTDLAHAKEMFKSLSGKTHQVYTGICLIHKELKKSLQWKAISKVTFRELTNEQIKHCLATCNPLDKAGGYAIQKHEGILIKSYQGLRSNVIGLPIEEVVEKLKAFEICI